MITPVFFQFQLIPLFLNCKMVNYFHPQLSCADIIGFKKQVRHSFSCDAAQITPKTLTLAKTSVVRQCIMLMLKNH